MFAIGALVIGLGVVVALVAARVNDKAMQHTLAEVTRYHSDAAIVPVQWGELLPAEQTPVVRIPAQPTRPEPAYHETRTPQQAQNVETGVIVPGLQACVTALSLALASGLLAWALGWSWRVPVVVFALAAAGSWFWRLGFADRLLWLVEAWTETDLNGDGVPGRPAVSYTLANPATARQAVAKETRQAAQTEAQAELLAFVDRCFMAGTAEGKHGVKAAGPDRTVYLAKRDVLLSLGVARWKNPERPRAGWELACSRQRARQVVSKHVL